VPAPASRSPELLRRWESLPTGVQGGVSFAVFALLMLFVNLSVFNQPLWRSILYALIEGAPLTVLLLFATANERRKRQQGRQDGGRESDS
jgi:hypothetical protein